MESDVEHAYTTLMHAWSWRFLPTPGTSATQSTPRASSSRLSPMPESMSSCGVLIAPALTMTSVVARIVVPSPRTMPAAAPCSTSTRSTRRPVSRSQFSRSSAGTRCADAAEQRVPSGAVVRSSRATPSGAKPFRSSEKPWPASTPAARNASKSGFSVAPLATARRPVPPRYADAPRSDVSQALKYGRQSANDQSARPWRSAHAS
mmetsp:Transcript_31662/g.95129  ORF Transcript_31662/g.95129 Transcript_31662/m.95129 type:complete len:205 (-) Transcript_31662:435-1049(-)